MTTFLWGRELVDSQVLEGLVVRREGLVQQVDQRSHSPERIILFLRLCHLGQLVLLGLLVLELLGLSGFSFLIRPIRSLGLLGLLGL